MRKTCVFLAVILLLTSINVFALAEDWTCPKCGRVNSGNFCPVDAQPKPTAAVDEWTCPQCSRVNTGNFCPVDAQAKPVAVANVWNCKQCGSKGLTGTFCTQCGWKNDSTEQDNGDLGELIFSGHMAAQGQVDTYTFTAVRDGYCVVKLLDIYGDNQVYIAIEDGHGRIAMDRYFDYQYTWTSNIELVAGETYTVTVEYYNTKPTDYSFAIYQTRPVLSITDKISDNFYYLYQNNHYSFTAPVSGTYVIALGDYEEDFYAGIYVEDSRGHKVLSTRMGDSSWSAIGRSNTHEVELTAGTSYNITMSCCTFGYYTLSITEKQEPVPTATPAATSSNPLIGRWYCFDDKTMKLVISGLVKKDNRDRASIELAYVFAEDQVEYIADVTVDGVTTKWGRTTAYTFCYKDDNCNLKINGIPFAYKIEGNTLKLLPLYGDGYWYVFQKVND